MTAGGDGFAAVAGGPALHIPVLGRPALDFLNVHDGGVYIDATFGAGGYTRAILAAANCKVIGIDRDQNAIALGADLVQAAGGRLTLIEERFANLDAAAREAGFDAVDGVVLDLGVSSMQLDNAERGFSFRLDGPLDMRMGGEGPSAADVVNAASERDLANIIFILGEERHSRAVARAIVKARSASANRHHARARRYRRLGRALAPRRHPSGHAHVPGACAFSSMTNSANLSKRLQAAERILKPQGRLVAVSFHSLEDRIVKSFFARRGETRAGSRHMPQAEPTGADLPRADQAPGHRRRRGGRRATRAPARPSCAPPSARKRPRATTMPPISYRVCRRSPTS